MGLGQEAGKGVQPIAFGLDAASYGIFGGAGARDFAVCDCCSVGTLENTAMRYITKSEMENVLRVASADPRTHVMVLFGATHGMRRSEIAALTLADLHGGQIKVARVKGSETTVHPLLTNPNPLFDEPTVLAAWLAVKPESKLLFPSSHGGTLTGKQVYNIVRECMLSAGIPEELAHAHSLKHFCASHLCRAGVGVEFVKTFVGHKDIKNTVRYLNISDEEASDKAREAFK